MIKRGTLGEWFWHWLVYPRQRAEEPRMLWFKDAAEAASKRLWRFAP